MKKSRQIKLLLTGVAALSFIGCEKKDEEEPADNTYQSGRGYYHAAYGGWFPLPVNSFSSTQGYYHGGSWHKTPVAPVNPSVSRSGFGNSARSSVG